MRCVRRCCIPNSSDKTLTSSSTRQKLRTRRDGRKGRAPDAVCVLISCLLHFPPSPMSRQHHLALPEEEEAEAPTGEPHSPARRDMRSPLGSWPKRPRPSEARDGWGWPRTRGSRALRIGASGNALPKRVDTD